MTLLYIWYIYWTTNNCHIYSMIGELREFLFIFWITQNTHQQTFTQKSLCLSFSFSGNLGMLYTEKRLLHGYTFSSLAPFLGRLGVENFMIDLNKRWIKGSLHFFYFRFLCRIPGFIYTKTYFWSQLKYAGFIAIFVLFFGI